MARKVTLEEWFQNAATSGEHEGGLTMLVMHLMTEGGSRRGEIIHKVARGSDAWDAKKTCELLSLKARINAQEKTGRQVYKVLAFFGNRGEAEDQFDIAVEQEDGVGHVTEAPDARGLTSQRMRHDEALGSMYVAGIQQLMGRMLEHNEQLSTELREVRADNRQMFEQSKEHALAAESRAFEFHMKQMAFERNSVLFKKAMELGGPLLNTLSGREVVPQTFADTQLVRAIVLHMHAQQGNSEGGAAIMKLLQGLPQEVTVALMSRANQLIEEERKAQEEMRNMSPFANPGADAAGETRDKMLTPTPTSTNPDSAASAQKH